jgi:tRNA uridine 5-carboxymethylaminomethyl modification enzyme
MKRVDTKIKDVERIKTLLEQTSIDPVEINPFLAAKNSAALSQKQKAAQLLTRPGVFLDEFVDYLPILSENLADLGPETLKQAEIQLKYQTYIDKEQELVTKMAQLENLPIPENLKYDKIPALSAEALQKFIKIKPKTLGQASRISGVNPSDIQILLVFLGR